MTINQILEQLKTSDKPVAKSLHTGDHFKVLIFGFRKGMKLQDHKAYHPTKLLVMSGRIIYHQNKKTEQLKKFDEVEIPPEAEHSVSALEDSLILLTQG
ncbi:MAG: hypothetical protein WEA56_02270 [Balneolaceae bacterium]